MACAFCKEQINAVTFRYKLPPTNRIILLAPNTICLIVKENRLVSNGGNKFSAQ